MSLSEKELQLHRDLIKAFNAYIKHNLRWEDKRFDKDAIRTRKALRHLIDIAYLRWREVNNERGKWEPEALEIAPEFFRQVVKKHSKTKNKDENNSST